ncbi:MAG: hypothetical protein JRJ68_10065 [Deltaproteobacteria bacterium]|nr:hypothetical protein [Deltaproteobacteria bacterium]
MRSLRRLCRITFLATALLLGILVLTGYRQNTLMSSYDTIVDESERTVFLYATIREQTTEGLLAGKPSLLLAAAKEFEKLHGRYTSMLDSHLIASQYKLSFLQNLDLEKIVINLKNLVEKPDNEPLIMDVLNQLRQINKQFLQFDRVVISEMRNRVMQYQKRALILMGLIISLTCFALLILYQKSVKPMLDLTVQAEEALSDNTFIGFTEEKTSSTEITALIDAFNQLLHNRQGGDSSHLTGEQRGPEVTAVINETTNGLNGIINYAQILADSGESDDMSDEQKRMIKKIISESEKTAMKLQKSLSG